MIPASSRRVVSRPVAAPATLATTTYQVWLTAEQTVAVNQALDRFGNAWAEWVKKAIERLKRETDSELHDILGGIKRTNREGKENMSFRLYTATLDEVKSLAAKYDSSVQTVLSTAFFMQALAPMIDLPDSDGTVAAH
ncbi:hypothetical protein ACR3H8_19500 [Pseudomonas aeruginosa]|nr:hypothetical protein [Pseudomonas aeruginosa]EIU2716198.1 hypothetical protein [Pseudomonas aeruginosa]EIU2863017.1 hypothetical protein [Pseudomonas aeruginosa]ELD5773005.1 hypothetical protein [Pseudomonas aeruginosa]ERW61162.1 hypothetical protein Q024_06481 [Pseudomonas aeruginosa BWHPSA011]ETV28934.1 hypothetical protein Q046_05851 [Pseudomonas aeruginosa BWHPSA041]